MKVGDKVRWLSSYERKIGEIVSVVPAGVSVQAAGEILAETEGLGDNWAYLKQKYTLRMDFGGSPRDHESYLVAVPQGTSGKAKAALYWPRVKGLGVVR